MIIQINIDFNSDEALYVQLCNEIIRGIALEQIHEGDALPSVRQLAEVIGINMHTVNKAYTVLKQEGFIKLDRRRGAVISLDVDKYQAIQELRENLNVVLTRAICKNVTREEAHQMVDEIFDRYMPGPGGLGQERGGQTDRQKVNSFVLICYRQEEGRFYAL